MSEVVPNILDPPKGAPIMIDPERIQSGKDAVYVSFKGVRFYDKTPEQLIKSLPTAVKRQLGEDFFKGPAPVVTNVASQAAIQQAQKVSGAEAEQQTEGIAAKPRAPSFRFLTRRAPTSVRKGSVLNSVRKTNAADAAAIIKKPSAFNRVKAFGTTMKKGATAFGSAAKTGASAVASTAKRTGSAASSMFGKPRGYERVLNSNVQVPEKNPFTNPAADNLSMNNPFQTTTPAVATKTKPVPLPRAKKPGMFQTLRNKTKGFVARAPRTGSVAAITAAAPSA